MKQNFFYFLLVVLFCTGEIQACSGDQNNLLLPDEEQKELNISAMHGVCRQNLQWMNHGEVVEIANNIANSHIPVVRINGVKERGSIEQVIHNINSFSNKGIKVLLVQPMWMDMFPEGYEKVTGPNYKLYRMSDIDLDRFRSFMNELLEQLAIHTPADALIGLELFNEANWGGFNGDLQPTSEGKGEVFTLETPLNHPSFQAIYTGILQYGKCLEITKDLMNDHFTGRDVKLVTTGLVSGGERNNYRWSINNGFTVIATNMFMTLLQGKHPEQTEKTNWLQFADGIGIHAYPALVDNMENDLRTYYFDPINAVLDTPMPYWMTEWGFSRPQFQNNGGEKRRLHYARNFIKAIETIGGTVMTALYEFDATNEYNIWENGALLESGKIFQEIID
ncbi:hypothetical protein [Proteiniphilum sp. UBA5384]|uniref:hypothetical protein n=1 Tax=Proteiniphilum sp. UBA5384 TaxID=1947279 RepID=UPI0025F380F2|nr:hypothetical protein [Proteiniphilum sp. UBA5384]